MEYVILKETTFESLDKVVNRYIRDGWVPQGGVAIAVLENNVFSYRQSDGKLYYTIAQAMTRK